MKVDPASLVEDDIFAYSVEMIIKHTGAMGLQVLFDSSVPQKRESIMKLSRRRPREGHSTYRARFSNASPGSDF